MPWTEVLKDSRLLIYTGTCPECGIFIDQKSFPLTCPRNLPQPAESHLQNIKSCPMKRERR